VKKEGRKVTVEDVVVCCGCSLGKEEEKKKFERKIKRK
jgi:hypothetical protein